MIIKRFKKNDDADAETRQTNHAEAHKNMQDIARAILDTIERGQNPAQQRADWRQAYMPAMNAVTRHRYTGGNRWLLERLAAIKGWPDPRFVTYKQCSAMKDAEGNPAHVLKGATGTTILRPVRFRKTVEIPEGGDATGSAESFEEGGKRYAQVDMVRFQSIRVFNIAQTTAHAPPAQGVTPRDWADCDFFEKFVQASGVRVKNDAPAKACFSPAHDCIHMPAKDAFQSSAQYYATLLHEFYHATGHSSRMNRGFSTVNGDERYAMEELRAELFSVACADMFGLDYPREKQAGYIACWSKRIRHDQSKAVLKAAGEVDTVLSAILDAAAGKQPDLPWFPSIDFTDFPTPLKECLESNHLVNGSGVNAPDMDELHICRALLPGEQLAALERGLGGPRTLAVREAMREIVEIARALPVLYTQEPYGQDATVYMRVTGTDGSECYLTELDLLRDTAYGYAVDAAGEVEFGEIPLDAIRSMSGRVDTTFTPASVAVIARQYDLMPEVAKDDSSVSEGDDEHSLSFSLC